MAFSTRVSLFFFFFTTLVFLSTQIHARDSYFFGKFQRASPKDQNPDNVGLPFETSEKTAVEESISNKKDEEQDPTFLPQSENGYGLYGHETTHNNKKYDEKVNGETFSTPSLSESEEPYNNYDDKYPKKTETYDNNGYNSKYDENVKEESFSENNEDRGSFYNSNTYGSELERETPYKGYSHNLERQDRMSDTRFMDKGNYYYDRSHDQFYRKPHRKVPVGYYASPATDTSYDQSSYSYGNNNVEEKSFKDPYNSKWEKNMMNERPEEFGEEQGYQFKP